MLDCSAASILRITTLPSSSCCCRALKSSTWPIIWRPVLQAKEPSGGSASRASAPDLHESNQETHWLISILSCTYFNELYLLYKALEVFYIKLLPLAEDFGSSGSTAGKAGLENPVSRTGGDGDWSTVDSETRVNSNIYKYVSMHPQTCELESWLIIIISCLTVEELFPGWWTGHTLVKPVSQLLLQQMYVRLSLS